MLEIWGSDTDEISKTRLHGAAQETDHERVARHVFSKLTWKIDHPRFRSLALSVAGAYGFCRSEVMPMRYLK
jgi:hypothetical protein